MLEFRTFDEPFVVENSTSTFHLKTSYHIPYHKTHFQTPEIANTDVLPSAKSK
jgi:hypothetical protein